MSTNFIMFFGVLFIYASCDIAVDKRKFLPVNDKFDGIWEFGGHSEFEEKTNNFILTTGKNHSFGFMFNNQRLPLTNWSTKITFNVDLKNTGSNKFAIWITDHFDILGTTFGGPQKFAGIGILAYLKNNNLRVEIRHNDGTLSFGKKSFFPSFENDLVDNVVTFELQMIDNIFKIECVTNSNRILLFEDQPEIHLGHFWLSITSYNKEGEKKPLMIKSIEMNGIKKLFVNKRNENDLTLKSIKKIAETNDNITVNDVINAIGNLIESGKALVNIDEVVELFHEKFDNYSRNWSRRSIKMKKNEKKLKKLIQKSLMNIEQFIYDYHSSLEETFHDYQMTISIINEKFKEDIDNDILPSSIEIKQSKYSEFVIALFIVEMIIIILCYLIKM